VLFYIDRSLTAPLLFAPGSLSAYPYARTPEELLEKVEEAQRQIEDGGPLSYTQFKRVWQYIVTRSTKERTYVRYINGQKIQRTVTPKLGEKAAHNGNVVYTLENPVKSTVFTRKTERNTASKPPVARLSSASAELTKRLLPKPWSVKAA
jgi:phage integrase